MKDLSLCLNMQINKCLIFQNNNKIIKFKFKFYKMKLFNLKIRMNFWKMIDKFKKKIHNLL